MSEPNFEFSVPEFDTSDRMRKSLRHSNTPVGEMAEYLGVTRETISRWINGRSEASIQTLRLWALRTGVPFVWLKDGKNPHPDKDPNGGLT
ncbi:MAG: helix-turn-helix transcriptional regulator, partial [Rhodococcus sp. (in: high G+C Gram-positive bacteria)]|uniref:helix-turn-helix domain-containing protein n=1 Tax=Rhodococcus sp. TaxID=1831 RepID=UPI002AD6C364|nr:helix-turn-helix transcriptional regulator [Rhodococcus sp. (in: high G+C Gram-positive bacteria)]